MADQILNVEVVAPGILKQGRLEAIIMRAVMRAGGDALRTMRTESTRKVRDRKALKLKNVREALDLVFPTAGGPVGDSKSAAIQWRLKVRGAPTPVYAYSPRQVKAGISVAINQGGRALIRHAFVATMKSGYTGVFMRYGERFRAPVQRYRGHKKYAGKRRQAIRELYTTKVQDVFRDTDFSPEVLDAAHQKFAETFSRNVRADFERAVNR